MSVQKHAQHEIQVNVTTTYVESESSPTTDYYYFAYRIRIENKGGTPAQLISRHWIIINELGVTEEVQGSGVVGQQPRIAPGQNFEYTSTCPLDTATGCMSGHFTFIDVNGEEFQVDIPEFYLVAPTALH
jgi:ApaG protein